MEGMSVDVLAGLDQEDSDDV